jgi:hypothetical protein
MTNLQTAPLTYESLREFIFRFEAGLVPREQWTHQAHLSAGYWYVHAVGREQALEVMRKHIRHHNESVGTPNTDSGGYHETITRLYLDGITAHIESLADSSFENGLAQLLASPMASNGWPLQRYSRQRLFSVEARRGWIEPDL